MLPLVSLLLSGGNVETLRTIEQLAAVLCPHAIENLRKNQARQEKGLMMRSLIPTLTLKVKVTQ